MRSLPGSTRSRRRTRGRNSSYQNVFSPTRFIQIGVIVYGHLFWRLLVRSRLLRPRLTPAQRFTQVLEHLGTAFVKLGQALSLHAEFLPEEYTIALASLQDHVAPFPGELAVREIEQSFGRTVTDLFAAFEPTPMAAASIAQVHAARLHDGREVIVKVRRPGIKRLVEQDMRIMAFLVRVVLVITPGLRRFDPLGLIQETLQNLRMEMDFRHEARNIQRFAEIFRDSPTIFVPPAIEGMQTEWVGVQHMSGGMRIDDLRLRKAGPKLAQAFVDAYLKQFFSVGAFHGDPHPGNLFIMHDGRICFHDFGLVGFLDQNTRRNLAAFMQAFVLQDAEWLLDAALALGVLARNIDRAEFSGRLEELLQDYAQLPLREWSLAEALLRITRMGTGRHVRMPRNLLVLMRTLFLMESTVRTLDPDFNFVDGLLGKGSASVEEAVAGRVKDGGMTRLSYETAIARQQIPEKLGSLVHKALTGHMGIQVDHRGLEDLASHVDRASSRMALSLVALGLYIAASLLMQHSIGPQLFDFPVLAALGYGLAGWLTVRVVRGTRNK
jgi:ubiquinone biosynthesis protein